LLNNKLFASIGIHAFLLTLLAHMALATPQKDLDSVIVYGDGWAFAIREPKGWYVDIKSGSQDGLNAVVLPNGAAYGRADNWINAIVISKTDEDLSKDLSGDMNSYSKRFPGLKFEDYKPKTSSFSSIGKVYAHPSGIREYLVYLNPDRNAKVFILFTLVTQGKGVSKFLTTYEELTGSFKWLGSIKIQK
jgi:hypothetical protein